MPFNAVFSWFITKRIHQIDLFRQHPVEVQNEVLQELVARGTDTEFGREHDFEKIRNASDFRSAIPIRTYEDFQPYIQRLQQGEQGILWPTKLKWFAKSSGTTSDRSKYIPVSKEALEECHYKGGKDLLALYYTTNPHAEVYAGKHLVMGGSSNIMPYAKDCYTGDLSAIIIRNLPFWVELKRIPSKEIALMDNWEHKIEKMAKSTMEEDVRMIAGVPSWTLVLLKRIMEIRQTENILEVWPNLELFMHGGVSFKPYREQFDKLVKGKSLNYLETYNASEGFFGIQDRLVADDMLLMLDYGIYYEFMPLEELGKEDPQTLNLDEVELGKSYALIISTNAGLWRYMVGDTIRFTSKDPYRVQVSGRTKHYINAFGEEVIVENAEDAINTACLECDASVSDFTVGPIFMGDEGKGAHEWLIEFDHGPNCMKTFTEKLDSRLREINSDYDAKRSFDLNLQAPVVRNLAPGTFYQWLKKKGKLGGQHKVPRLSNDRHYIEEVLSLQRMSV